MGDLTGVRACVTDDEDKQDPCSVPPSRTQLERPIQGPLPESVPFVRANLAYVEKRGPPSAMLNRLLRLAAFQNPDFYKAQKIRLSTYAKPRVIACGEDFAGYVALPRGCLSEIVALLEAHGIRPEVRDERFAGTRIEMKFHGSRGRSKWKPSPRSPRIREGRQPILAASHHHRLDPWAPAVTFPDSSRTVMLSWRNV
jgi:hypothetical protein